MAPMPSDRKPSLDPLPNEIALLSVLRANDAAQFCGVSLSHFRRLHALGQLPRPIRLGERRLGWRLGDLVDWLKSREAKIY